MNNGLFSLPVTKYTALNSNYETRRNYISLSHVVSSIDEIIDEYNNGFVDSVEVRLKCYKGYQMERDLLNRIKAVYADKIRTDIEITAFNGWVKGHPDFYFEGYPADCKSVLLTESYQRESTGRCRHI